TADAFRLGLGAARAHAEEAQVQILRRHRLMHRAHRFGVGGARGPYLSGAPVGQQRVDPLSGPSPPRGARSLRVHAAPPSLRASLSPGLRSAFTASPAGMMRAYWSGCTIAMWPSFCHLMMYGGEPSSAGTPITKPTRSCPITSRSPACARMT